MTTPTLPQLVERVAGLAIDRVGRDSIERFVNERMRALELRRVEDYLAMAADPAGAEQRRLIEAITVPHTWFYRDPEQLDTIAKLLVAAPAGPIAVWVAGCATGEEAYTIAMIGRRVGRELRVFATDINESALAAARRGVYSALAVRDVPELERHWISQRDDGFVVDPLLRANVSFTRHNLVETPPRAPWGGWDLVVCRNVLIYFAPGPAARVFDRFAQAVREGGSLVVGASEIVFKPPRGLELLSSGKRLVLRRPVPRSLPRLVSPAARRTVASTPGALPAASAPAAAPIPPTPPPIIKRQPTQPERDDDLVAALSRGHALFERGEIAGAIPVYAELAERYGQVAEVWLFLGIARHANGDFDEAAHALRASLCLDPALWPACFFLARAYERLGRKAEAQQQYDRVAVDALQPFALQSASAVINELRAFQHDFQAAARRLATERGALPPRLK